jgi:hypothetical protein
MFYGSIIMADKLPPYHCIGCIHNVRGVCALICGVPEHRCDFYEISPFKRDENERN